MSVIMAREKGEGRSALQELLAGAGGGGLWTETIERRVQRAVAKAEAGQLPGQTFHEGRCILRPDFSNEVEAEKATKEKTRLAEKGKREVAAKRKRREEAAEAEAEATAKKALRLSKSNEARKQKRRLEKEALEKEKAKRLRDSERRKELRRLKKEAQAAAAAAKAAERAAEKAEVSKAVYQAATAFP